MKYVLVIDAAQGERKGADSFAACVAHDERRDGHRVAVQDVLFEAVPPFSPRTVLAEIATVARRYHITRVHGDAHAKGFVAELLREQGLTFVELERDKSALCLDALAMLNSGQAILLDHPKQRRQILALRRALHSGGRVSVEHPRGGHDDVANVGLAALVVAFGVGGKKPKQRVWFSGMDDGERELVARVEAVIAEPDSRKRWELEQALGMAELVRVAKEDGEAQARRAHELGRAHPGERLGAGELVDLLLRERGGDV